MARPNTPGKRSSSARTARKPADVLLSASLLEGIPDAIVAVDKQGKIVQVNSQSEQMFGYSRDELLGQSMEILVPERYRDLHGRHREGYVHQPKVRRMGAGLDLYARRRDGSEFPVEISLSPVEGKAGILVLSAIRDISDRKAIEEELRRAHAELERRKERQLRESENRLALIVDSSEDAIIGKDLDGIILTWNKGAEHIYGYTAAEIIGKPISLLTAKNRPAEIPTILGKIRRGEIVDHYESIRVTKDGRHLNMSITISPIRDTDGTIVGASAIARNITAQKKTEEMLRQAQKMEAVGRLAGGVAHDFNNILGIITACTELLRDRIDSNSAASPYLENVRKAADRGAILTRQLLAFSRKQTAQPHVLDLNERLKETVKLLRPLMGDDVEIVIHAKPDWALIEVDPSQLDQTILNLAINSRDAMPHGGKFILETASMNFDAAFAAQHPPMTAGKYILLAVSDTGAGMDETTVSRIFEPFFTTKEIGKGTGLGLATVYGIVRQNGGHIWVYSEPGRGTTFKIYWPSAEHKVRTDIHSEIHSEVPKRHGTTILLVEDDELMRGLTKQMLEEHGYTIVEAADGKAALEIAASNHRTIDLLLTDVVMRGMNGPELSARLRASSPGLKVVYMSGYTGELIAEHDFLQPGVTLLEKPFTRSALLTTIDKTLG
jgi:PAS domain S-box-containing protein